MEALEQRDVPTVRWYDGVLTIKPYQDQFVGQPYTVLVTYIPFANKIAVTEMIGTIPRDQFPHTTMLTPRSGYDIHYFNPDHITQIVIAGNWNTHNCLINDSQKDCVMFGGSAKDLFRSGTGFNAIYSGPGRDEIFCTSGGVTYVDGVKDICWVPQNVFCWSPGCKRIDMPPI